MRKGKILRTQNYINLIKPGKILKLENMYILLRIRCIRLSVGTKISGLLPENKLKTHLFF